MVSRSDPRPKSCVLITGLGGFTGRHLATHLSVHGYEVVGLDADLCDRAAVFAELAQKQPDYVVHLAAISFAAEANVDKIYSVNVGGTINLLDALCQLPGVTQRVIVASSATVYGNQSFAVLDEGLCPAPINHYGCSKLSMEHLCKGYADKLNIVITRPFNYTGVGHANHFLLPKIVKAYIAGEEAIELGNLHVAREFNDVRDVCGIYESLLTASLGSPCCTVNICSGRGVKLLSVIEMMDTIAGYQIEVKVNPLFVRPNDIASLTGSTQRLSSLVSVGFNYSIQDTLRWMYSENN